MQDDPRQALETSIEEGEDEQRETELSSLLDLTLSDLVGSMSEKEANEYIAAVFEGSEIDTEHMLFAHVTPQLTPNMAVTDYRPDQAVREASLARKEQWRSKEGEITYYASNAMEVYLGTPEHPLELPQAFM